MKANELRIGNLVLRPDLNELNHSISEPKPHYVEFTDLCNEHRLKPIPLTEEWLVKFGFDDDFHIGKFWVTIDDNGYYYTNHKLNDNGFTEVLFVHSLQNLYFALTGEELTIK